ncbi:MAG: glycoside hydrolase family 108 protein [Roseicyclus sp.]
MSEAFKRVLPKILVHEGGFVNHPADPGGATNKGVTQRTYNAYRRLQGDALRSVREIADEEVQAIYRAQYWDAVRADELPPGVGYAVFDAAVNSGPARAAQWLQRAVGATVDGVVGVETLAATREASPTAVIDSICDQRLRFMRRLKHYDTFAKGWERRVSEVRQQALTWARTGGEDKPGSQTDAPAAEPASPPGAGGFWPSLLALLRNIVGGKP